MSYQHRYHGSLGALGQTSLMAQSQASGVRMMQAVATVAEGALESAVTRRLCYLYDQSGCGRFGMNEAHGNDKAADEERRVIRPLTSTAEKVASFLVARGEATAEVPVVRAQLRPCEALSRLVDSKFNEFKGVPYHDPLRRNNIRGEVISKGRALVSCLGAVRASSTEGQARVRAAIEAALVKSRARKTCYLTKASGCDKSGESEPNEREKAAEEQRAITGPLEALLARPPSAMGQVATDRSGRPSAGAWFGIGAAVVGTALLLRNAGSKRRRPRPNRRKKRRSSRKRRTSRRRRS